MNIDFTLLPSAKPANHKKVGLMERGLETPEVTDVFETNLHFFLVDFKW